MQNEPEQLALPPAAVEAVAELVEVALEVLGADAVEGPTQLGLEVAEDGVRPRQDVQRLPPVPSLARTVVSSDTNSRALRRHLLSLTSRFWVFLRSVRSNGSG